MGESEIFSLAPIGETSEGRSRTERHLRHRLCRVGLEVVADFLKLFNGLKRRDEKLQKKLHGAAGYFHVMAWSDVLADGSIREPREPRRGLPDDAENMTKEEDTALHHHLDSTISIAGSVDEAARSAVAGYLEGPTFKAVEETYGTPIVLSSIGADGEARARLDAYRKAHLAALEPFIAWHIRNSGSRTAYAHAAQIAEAGQATDVAKLIRQVAEEAAKSV